MTTDQKIDTILKSVQDIKIELAKHIVHQQQHRKEIDEVKLLVKNHETNQNKFFGIASVLGAGLTAFFSWIFKHY